MTLKAFQKPSSLAPDLEVLARSVTDFTQQLTKNPTIDGVLIQGIDLTAGTLKDVPHSLGRPWVGMVVTYKTTFADVIATHNPMTDSLTLPLTSNVSISCDVWVF